MVNVVVVLGCLAFLAIALLTIAYAGVQITRSFSASQVEMQKDFSQKLVAGIDSSQRMKFAGGYVNAMASTIVDEPPMETRNNGRHVTYPPQRVPDGFPQPRPAEAH